MIGKCNTGGGGKPEEEKTVTAGTSAIVVNPSSGKVMKKVTVNPTPTEEKTITAGTSATTVTPTSGKYIKKVTVKPTPSQSKTVTPSTSQQTVSPDSGKLLSQVIVKAMEDVTPEVTAQTPIITQIAENLGVTITTPSGTNKHILQGNNANLLNIKNNAKKEGAYVWKKSTKPITLHFTQTSGAWGTPITLQVTSSEIDVNTLTGEDFVGVKGTCGSYIYEFTSATEFIGLTYTSPIEYSYSNGIITIQGTIASVETWSDYTKEGQFLDYLVSDNESAYPDGGEQGGYWYEKVVEGVAGIDFGEVKLSNSSYSVKVAHNLGVVPSFVALIPKTLSIPFANEIAENINGKVLYSSAANTLDVMDVSNELTSSEITFQTEYSTKYIRQYYYWIAIA